MSLASRLTALAQAVGADIKADRIRLQGLELRQPSEVNGVANLPDPLLTANSFRLVRDTQTGILWFCNGATWKPVGEKVKAPVSAVIATNWNLATASPNTVDGVAFTPGGSGDRILLIGQTTKSENGIYLRQGNGVVGSAMIRATDANESGDWLNGMLIPVLGGTLYGGRTVTYTGVDNPTIGTTNLVFLMSGGVVPMVTALPTAADGDEVNYQASAAKGIIWKFRYRAKNADGSANTNTFKWEFVGGSDLFDANIASTGQTLTTAEQNLTNTPVITVPLAGQYQIDFSWNVYGTVADDYLSTIGINGVHQEALGTAWTFSNPMNLRVPLFDRVVATLAANDVIRIMARNQTAGRAVSHAYRKLTVRPIMVG